MDREGRGKEGMVREGRKCRFPPPILLSNLTIGSDVLLLFITLYRMITFHLQRYALWYNLL